MPKDNIIKRRSSHSKVQRPSVASLRRRKSASAVLQPNTRNTDKEVVSLGDSNTPLVLKQGNLNVSAGRNLYERAGSRRERHRLALKNNMKLGEEDGSNHFVALGRGGARGPNETSLTREVPEGDDPGLLAIAASKRQARQRKTAAYARRGGSTLGEAGSKSTATAGGTSQRNRSVFAAKMKATSKKSKRIPVRQKLLKR
ncbi:MAG: hypothetical protein SGBAC_013462 [Bacillariaceae sp.]